MGASPTLPPPLTDATAMLAMRCTKTLTTLAMFSALCLTGCARATDAEAAEGATADASTGAPSAAPIVVRTVPTEEVVALLGASGSTTLLDVRSVAEFAAGHVPGAINIPVGELADRLDELEAARAGEIVVYCERGGRAVSATEILGEAGFTQLGHLEGDMSAWRAAGHVVE